MILKKNKIGFIQGRLSKQKKKFNNFLMKIGKMNSKKQKDLS